VATTIAINLSTQGKQVWSGRNKTGDVNTLLLINTDLTNAVTVGNDLTGLVVPIPPNGSISVDPVENWYAQGSVAGQKPLVIVPNGQANFRGLSQGQGSIAIPSFFSPNFVHGVSGWSINQDGSAEFQNALIRGTLTASNVTFPNGYLSNGDGTYTTTAGLFIYNGTPAAGNLIFSQTNTAGNDTFGNNYLPGTSNYDNTAHIATQNGATSPIGFQWYTFTANPGAVFTLNSGFTIFDTVNLIIACLDKLQLAGGLGALLATTAHGYLQTTAPGDLVNYTSGHNLTFNGGTVPINSTTPITVHSFARVLPGRYLVRGVIRFTSSTGTIQPMLMRLAGNATFTCAVKVKIHQEGANVVYNTGYISTQNADPNVGPNLANSLTYQWEYEGYIDVSVQGTYAITCRQGLSAADETFTVLAASWAVLQPAN